MEIAPAAMMAPKASAAPVRIIRDRPNGTAA
jgi:hypothetical protein